jgi:methyl-accepting chemotaxis protein
MAAARAGEQGRGFAVVADEVRTLASSTQESTTEIQTMIEKLQAGSSSAVQVMESNKLQTLEVVKSAANAVDSIKTVNTSIDEINQINAGINDITNQQSQSAEQMNQTIGSINQLTSITSQYADQNRTASQELDTLTVTLKDLIAQFKVA